MSASIVLGYDGSACSAAALDEAVELARGQNVGEIILVYCHEPPPGLSCELDPTSATARELRQYEHSVERDVRPMLQAAVEKIQSAGVHADLQMVWEDPAHALVHVAQHVHAHLIVVGSHGEGPLHGALRHCAPYEVLRRSDVPVLVVPLRH